MDYKSNIENNPIFNVEKEQKGTSLSFLKSRIDNSKALQKTIQVDIRDQTKQKSTSTAIMPSYEEDLIHEDPPHVNTMTCKESILYTKNILKMDKDGCNTLQLLIPTKHFRTVLMGSGNSPQEELFEDVSEDSAIEIVCSVVQINKLTGDPITNLLYRN